MTTAAVTTTKTRAARATVKPVAATTKTTQKPAAKTVAPVVPKVTPKAAVKTTPLSLAAGLAVLIAYPKLNRALKNHYAVTGCLRKVEVAPAKDGTTPKGVLTELTQYGANKWNVERVSRNADLFQKIAAFVKRGGPAPEFWAKQPPVEVAKGIQFPNPIYWGSFATAEMRLAFAAIWSK